MTFSEFLIRLVAVIKPALPAAIAVLALSLAMIIFLAIRAKGLWVNMPQFRTLGIFYELPKLGCLRLSCSWVKFLILVIYLLIFRKAQAAEYLLFLIPGLIYALCGNPIGVGGRLLWLVLEFAGLLSAKLVCGYYYDMHGGTGFIVIYYVMALFMILFGCYLFLTEVEDISEGRGAVQDEI